MSAPEIAYLETLIDSLCITFDAQVEENDRWKADVESKLEKIRNTLLTTNHVISNVIDEIRKLPSKSPRI